MFSMLPVLAYFSPETMLPLSSLIATIVGFGLLIKRSTIRFVLQSWRAAIGSVRHRVASNKPHFAERSRSSARKPQS
jgi:hypothetical protein